MAAVAFAGGAYAATQQPPTNAKQAFLDDVAKRLHVTPAQLNSALKGAAIDQLAAAVKSGRLTQAQANELKQRIERKGTVAPLFFGAPGLHRQFFLGVGPLGAHGPLAAAAKYLGLTDAQLRKQLVSGKSLAQISKAQGKSTSGLEQALTVSFKQRLDKAVANKRITAAQEQQLLSRLSSRISDLINRTLPKNPGMWGHPGMGHGGFGYGLHGARSGRFAPPPGGGPAGFSAAPAPAGPVA